MTAAIASKLQVALDWLKEAALSDQPSTKARVASRVKLLRDAIATLAPTTEQQVMDIGYLSNTEQQTDAWEDKIVNSCTDPNQYWMSHQFIRNLREHKRKYPAFKPERVAEIFIYETSAKTRAWYCYRPISYFTKSIQKANSFRSFAASQS